jgi:hypothetical protein
MKHFRPQSPNPSIRKSPDATLAVLGQLNELVDAKTDVVHITTPMFDQYPYIITPVMNKVEEKLTIQYADPANTLKTYRIQGSLYIDEGLNYFNVYLGSIEFSSPFPCNFITMSKSTGNMTAYDGDYRIITPFAVGGYLNDPTNGGFPSLTQADFEMSYYEFPGNGQFNAGYDLFMHGYTPDASALQGDINFEIEFQYVAFCNPSAELSFYAY